MQKHNGLILIDAGVFGLIIISVDIFLQILCNFEALEDTVRLDKILRIFHISLSKMW